MRIETPSTVTVVVVCVDDEFDVVDEDDDIDESDDSFDFFLSIKTNEKTGVTTIDALLFARCSTST
jgi:hypothetical protein